MNFNHTFRKRARAVAISICIVIALLFAVARVRLVILTSVDEPRAEWIVQASRVEITRDEWGVPHIYGETDADAAFGLAYAHAEDDFSTIQGSLVAGRGDLALLLRNMTGIQNDFFVNLFRINQRVDAQYDTLRPETRAMLEGYANGLNYYAALHPDEADGRFFPVSGKDVARGFVHKIPLFQRANMGIGAVMSAEEPLPPGTKLPGRLYGTGEDLSAHADLTRGFEGRSSYGDGFAMIASNSHAVGRTKSSDGIVRLNVNSHQPWTGPLAWYEAHIQSGEGWNAAGGTFPGGPVIFMGHNENLGWTHTVNHPDMWDVFVLETDPEDSTRYRVDGEWLTLTELPSEIEIDLYLFSLTLEEQVYESIYGPTVVTDHGAYSFRVAGHDRTIYAVEQWYRMNRARNFNEWKDAMRQMGLPMFNTVYADRNSIHYVYNAALPIRSEGYDWDAIVPGNTRETLWTEYLPYDRLPAVTNPPTGFVQNCNSTPFRTTTGPYNPRRSDFSETMGIETRMTNRALRSLQLYGSDPDISR